ncbi:hypothetical protein [Ornithinibacillus scapharcae]|uniref:hypothetical protein n=1 Tax=Ornithinibacillus scapharcae TaxID=1147159 RepID=UPI000225BA15|nr:hypothetical protein [Ornithinibacillus scapharcae]
MPLWLLLLFLIGGLLIISLIADWVIKNKKIKIDLEEGVKHANESERIYTEKALDDVRHKIGNDNGNL